MEYKFGAAQQNKNKERRKMWFAFGIFTVLSAGLLIYNLLTSKTPVEQLSEYIATYNKSLPMEVNATTRLDSMSMPNENIYAIYGTIHMLKADISADSLEIFYHRLSPMIIDEVKNNPSFKLLRDNNLTLKCIYSDENGEFLYEFTVTPDLYRE